MPEMVPAQADNSMGLLSGIYRTALDPAYAEDKARWPAQGRRFAILIAFLLFGAMLGVAITSQLKSAPASQQERTQLITRIKAEEKNQDALREQADGLTIEVRALQLAAAGLDPATQQLIGQLEVLSGMSRVSGPGLVIVADDAIDGTTNSSRVVDVDLRAAVNSLWRAGAEAIAINGHRLSARTAIRGAGDAITVDYRSLTRPYRIEAIGGPDLLSRFRNSEGAGWWAYLQHDFGIQFDVAGASSLTLAADPGLGISLAKAVEK